MTDLHPHDGTDHDAELVARIAKALGYDLEKIERGEDPGSKCPCCAIDALIDLVKDERLRLYRKGWQRIVDDETPPVPDLIYGTQLEVADLQPPTS